MTHWFDRARFGMFVHWDHASQRGWEISWPMVGPPRHLIHCQDVKVDEYHASAATFRPEPRCAREWMSCAARAGMQYAVFTAKHHSGYAMYPTKLSDFSVAASPCEGDLVREYVDAAREAGLRVGLYFSLPDWSHPDYPAFRDEHRPYRFGHQTRPTAEGWERFVAHLHGQVRELLTDYGTIDLIWFDGGWERSPEQWRSAELEALIRELQPDILINDRLPGIAADFATPEQFVPAAPPDGRWEVCETMNTSWAYNPDDTDYKSSRALVHTLCEVAGRGGNLLLDVGPDGAGRLPEPQRERLADVGRWMGDFGAAIVDTQPGLESWQFYGPSTRRGDRIFLHLLMRPYESVTVRGVPIERVRGVRQLASGASLGFAKRCSVIDGFGPDPVGDLVIRVPESEIDPLATVLELEIASTP